jgi:hypothetical protein
VPTTTPTDAPTEDDNTGSGETCKAPKVSTLSRDLVHGSLKNGPHWGSRHGWAWPGASDGSCDRFENGEIPSSGYAWPCSVSKQLLNRVLNFDSSYLNFQFEFDQGMKATLSLGSGVDDSASAVSFYPSGGSGNACNAPPEQNWNDYPVRLVKSGRYLHHWYAERVGCNGKSDDTRLEIKVTPDCVELHMVSTTGAASMNWMSSDGDSLVSSSDGYSGISFCVQCDSELLGGNNGEQLSGCSIASVPVPTLDECCPLSAASSGDNPDTLCGTGKANYATCDASKALTTALSHGVSVSVSGGHRVLGDGHSYEIRLPRGGGNQMTNDKYTVTIDTTDTNHTGDDPKNQLLKKVKMNFHVEGPKRITGVSGILRDPTTKEPTGIHVQMSKNWHVDRNPALYDAYWWTGIAHVRVPTNTVTELELVVAYQYYNDLHAVSHSQLSLLGWATNGLWEEVGLGANGESITFEPHGHHRRQMILDTRPWLTCALGSGNGCNGSPDNTQWTENHGGGDFLNAIDVRGQYQYLVEDTVYHNMNGPRLTNATYEGITQDTNIDVKRTVSTWTADDFVRHLHSFKYTFLKEVNGNNYPRFAMYTLGGDNYNYVQFPWFTYGMGSESELGDALVPIDPVLKDLKDFYYDSDFFQVDAPVGCGGDSSSSCWFAMVTNPSINIDQRGNRGIVVRNFHGVLNGEPWPPANGDDVSPFTFSMIKSRQNGSAQNTVSIELGLPNSFIDDVKDGKAKFKLGDYLESDIELFLPPRQTRDYFGKSDRLKAWLTEADVDVDYHNGWKVIAKEAVAGDELSVEIFTGSLERKYHPRVHVDCSDFARFNIVIPSGMPGILPITISGVSSQEEFSNNLLDRPDGKLWRYSSGTWKEFSSGGDYQLEKDVATNSYNYVYSLRLEFESDPVTECEQFYFGPEPPEDTNPPCLVG